MCIRDRVRSRPPPKRVTDGVDTTATVATSVSIKPTQHIGGKNLSRLREITKQNRTSSSNSGSSSGSDSEETVSSEAAKNAATPRLTTDNVTTMETSKNPRAVSEGSSSSSSSSDCLLYTSRCV